MFVFQVADAVLEDSLEVCAASAVVRKWRVRELYDSEQTVVLRHLDVIKSGWCRPLLFEEVVALRSRHELKIRPARGRRVFACFEARLFGLGRRR